MSITFHNSASNDANSTTTTVTLTITAGRTVVVVIGLQSSGTASSVTDTGGSTYTQKAAKSSSNRRVEIWATQSASACRSTRRSRSAAQEFAANGAAQETT